MAHLDEQDLLDWLDDALDEGRREALLTHTDGCDPCRELLVDALRTEGPTPGAAGSWLAERYELVEPLGAGAMGVVWRARDHQLATDVALKLLPPERAGDAEALARFRDELLLARAVSHPNVCRLHDLVEDGGRWFITMELIDGAPLSVQESLPPDRLRSVLRQVADGLAAAHSAGVVHRDLKPSNILITAEGRAVVADFGIARRHGTDSRTRTGAVIGTPRYMAPEQRLDSRVDARADVYALGLIGRELLGEQADPSLDAVLRACLQADPADRPADGAAVVSLLDGAPSRRWPLPAAAAALLLALAWILAPGPPDPGLTLGMFTTADPADAWLGEALPALVREELADGWDLEATITTDPDAAAITAMVRREDALHATVRAGDLEQTVSAASPRALALAIATRLAGDAKPPQAELDAAACTTVAAWQLTRRARRAAALREADRMLALAQQANELDPSCPLPWLYRSAMYEEGDAEGIALADRAVALSADGPARLQAQTAAWAAYLHGDHDALEAQFGKLAVLAIDDPFIQMEIGRFLLSVGQIDRGLAILEARSRVGAERALALSSLAEWESGSLDGWLTRAPAPARALEHADAAVQESPHDLGARALRALARALNGDHDGARADADLVLRWAPEPDDAAVLALVTSAAMRARWDEAGAAGRRLLDDPRHRAAALQLLAGVDLARGAFERGLARAAEAATLLDSQDRPYAASWAWSDLAWAALTTGDTRLAAEAHAKATASGLEPWGIQGENELMERVIAKVAAGGESDPLLPWFRGVVAAQDTSALDAVAVAHLELFAAWHDADWEEVRALHRTVALTESAETWTAWPAALAAEQSGDLDAAEAAFRSLAEDPYSWEEPMLRARAQLGLGRVLARAGRTGDARAVLEGFIASWDRAPADAPELKEARAILGSL